jgi:hypothetical protein
MGDWEYLDAARTPVMGLDYNFINRYLSLKQPIPL